jgi:hypothetical protein
VLTRALFPNRAAGEFSRDGSPTGAEYSREPDDLIKQFVSVPPTDPHLLLTRAGLAHPTAGEFFGMVRLLLL